MPLAWTRLLKPKCTTNQHMLCELPMQQCLGCLSSLPGSTVPKWWQKWWQLCPAALPGLPWKKGNFKGAMDFLTLSIGFSGVHAHPSLLLLWFLPHPRTSSLPHRNPALPPNCALDHGWSPCFGLPALGLVEVGIWPALFSLLFWCYKCALQYTYGTQCWCSDSIGLRLHHVTYLLHTCI